MFEYLHGPTTVEIKETRIKITVVTNSSENKPSPRTSELAGPSVLGAARPGFRCRQGRLVATHASTNPVCECLSGRLARPYPTCVPAVAENGGICLYRATLEDAAGGAARAFLRGGGGRGCTVADFQRNVVRHRPGSGHGVLRLLHRRPPQLYSRPQFPRWINHSEGYR